MILIYYKVVYFCSPNIYLDSHKVKTIILQCCYFAVVRWHCCCYVACSLLVVTAGLFLIHCTNCWKKKDSILFYHFSCVRRSIHLFKIQTSAAFHYIVMIIVIGK